MSIIDFFGSAHKSFIDYLSLNWKGKKRSDETKIKPKLIQILVTRGEKPYDETSLNSSQNGCIKSNLTGV